MDRPPGSNLSSSRGIKELIKADPEIDLREEEERERV